MRAAAALLCAPLLCGAQQQPAYDAIVVGTGGGGLAAAAQLTLEGRRVLMLEKNDIVGGLMRDVVMHSDDIDDTTGEPVQYRLDATLHLMQAPYDEAPLANMFTLLNRTGVLGNLTLTPVKEVLHVIAGNYTADIPTDEDAAVKQYSEKFGEPEENIRSFIQYCKKYMEDSDKVTDMQWKKGLAKDKKIAWIELEARELLDESMTAAQLVNKYIKSKDLQGHILSPITAGLFDPKDTAALLYAVIIGGWYRAGMVYPVGGSARIARLLAEYVTRNGGTLMLETEVTSIIVEDAGGKKRAVGVTTKGGKEFRAPAVVSNMVLTTTLDMAGRGNFPADYIANIETFNLSASVFSVFFGIRNASVLAPLAGHPETMIMNSLDFDAEFEIMGRGEVGFLDFYNYGPVDSTVAPAGRTAGSVMLAQYRHWWPKDPVENKKKREELKEKMLAKVEEHVPGLRAAIDEATLFTRDTYEWEGLTGTLDGSTLGWYPDTHTQSRKGMPQQATPIEGLFQAGMFCFPGGGQQAVLMGGIIAAECIVNGINMPLNATAP